MNNYNNQSDKCKTLFVNIYKYCFYKSKKNINCEKLVETFFKECLK